MNNKETIQSIEDILYQASNTYQYVSTGKNHLSFFEIDSLDKVKESFQKRKLI